MKFFRRIRQKFIFKGKSIQYIKYATGEILLVVLGILIALQVNNWNEERKAEIKEIKYLKRLKADLLSDTIYYNQRMGQSKEAIGRNSRAIKMAYKDQNTLQDVFQLLNTYEYSAGSYLTVQNDTYQEMRSTGKLDIIQNESLKIGIIALYRSVSDVEKKIKEYTGLTQLLLADLNASIVILKYYPYDVIKEVIDEKTMLNRADWEFINDPTTYKFRVLENCMLTYILRDNDYLSAFKELKNESTLILELIDEELKNRNAL